MRRTGKMLGPDFFVAGLAHVVVGVPADRRPGQRSGALRVRLTWGALRAQPIGKYANYKECKNACQDSPSIVLAHLRSQFHPAGPHRGKHWLPSLDRWPRFSRVQHLAQDLV